jgi:hypothetical protein
MVKLPAALGFVLLQIGCSSSDKGVTDDTNSTIEDSAQPMNYPLFLSTMTHMEAGHSDDTTERVFEKHVDSLRETIALASEHNAKITIESEIPFATGCQKWGVNMMLEVLEAGHGVGTHCDITEIDADNTTHAAYVAELLAKKEAVDALVGAENNLGCSGAGGGTLDWVGGMTDAGFGYINATVSMHYLSMDEDAWPDSSWTAQYIKAVISHEPSPADLYDRIYLRKLADSSDFDHDPEGQLVLSSGGLGRVDAQAADESEDQFTMADVDALIATLKEINENRDATRVAKVELHLSLEHLEEETWPVLMYFFEQMNVLQNEGVVLWATQAEIYKTYLDSVED